jgi:hypothetical protein
VCHGLDLELERRHVGEQPGLEDLVGVDVLFLEVRRPLGEEAFDGSQDLQEARHCGIVQGQAHGRFPSCG